MRTANKIKLIGTVLMGLSLVCPFYADGQVRDVRSAKAKPEQVQEQQAVRMVSAPGDSLKPGTPGPPEEAVINLTPDSVKTKNERINNPAAPGSRLSSRPQGPQAAQVVDLSPGNQLIAARLEDPARPPARDKPEKPPNLKVDVLSSETAAINASSGPGQYYTVSAFSLTITPNNSSGRWNIEVSLNPLVGQQHGSQYSQSRIWIKSDLNPDYIALTEQIVLILGSNFRDGGTVSVTLRTTTTFDDYPDLYLGDLRFIAVTD